MGISVYELEHEPEELLRQRYEETHLSESVLHALRTEQFTSFEVGFELAARICVPPANCEAMTWLRRYVATGRGVPDAVPWWDVASRQWLLKVARVAPKVLKEERESLTTSHQRLSDFCLAVSAGRHLPDDVGEAVARHFLNAGPGSFAYSELIDLQELARSAERLLATRVFPILRRERVEALVPYASDTLLLELSVNYCGQDFRSFGRSLLEQRASIDAMCLEQRAKRECSSEGRIMLGLHYAHQRGHGVELPDWASEALLLDLRSGSNEDVSETLNALLAIDLSQARDLLAQALRERRAVLMVPALADEELLKTFLARIEEGLVDRETAVAALQRCGEEGLNALLNLGSSRRPAVGLASVVAEALASLLASDAASSHRKRAAELLVPWLGHSSKSVAVAARRTLEQLGETAREALQAGVTHDRKAVRAESSRMLEWLGLRRPTTLTPLDVVRESATLLETEATNFLLQCHELTNQPERWSLALLPQLRKYGAVCLEWLRPWFEQHVPHGDVRLWCYAVEVLAQDDDAAWVAVDTFARAPKLPTSLWARPRRALGKMGSRLAEPVAFVLAHVSSEYREPLYRLLARHGAQAQLRVLLAGLADESKPIRSHAVDALSRLPSAVRTQCLTAHGDMTRGDSVDAKPVLAEVLSLLQSPSPGTRIAAAELLAVWGERESRSALLAALKTEKRTQVRAYLEEALVAVGAMADVLVTGLTSALTNSSAVEPSAELSEQTIGAFLETRADSAKVPRFLLMSPPPELSFRNGSKLSDAAQLGFMALASQMDATLKGRLSRHVAVHLDPQSLAAWSRHVYERWMRSKDIRFKWALYQLWVFADEALIAEVGAEVGRLRANEHATVSCYLRVLQWRSSRAALDWLIHWGNALPSRGLRELARDLLGRVAHKSGETVANLLREADPWVAARHFEAQPEGPLDGRGQERWTRHLEQTLLTGRSWSVDEFERLAASKATLLRGLIWLVCSEKTSTPLNQSCLLFDGQSLLDEEGKPVQLEETDNLRLLHPLDLSEEQAAAWSARVNSLAVAPVFEQAQRPYYIYGGERDVLLSDLDTDSERLDAWLRRDRWFHGEPLDHGIVYSNALRVAAQGVLFRIEHSGYPIGRHEGVEAIEVRALQSFDLMGNTVDLAEVPARTYSEVCLSLGRLNSSAV